MSVGNQINSGCKGAHLKIGYARVCTKEQSFDLQVDAIYGTGCRKVYKGTVSRALSERQELNDLLRVPRTLARKYTIMAKPRGEVVIPLCYGPVSLA